MKPTGPHTRNNLSPPRIRALTKPGRYSDGNGLYLVVSPSGSKRWILRTVVQGRRTDIGLGGLSTTSLAKARKAAAQLREVARDGGDPVEERLKEKRSVPIFRAAAEQVHSDHKPTWKNEKHAAQWIKTLEEYAYPWFGDKRVNQVDAAEVLKALSPIWLTKPETARRVRQRIGTVLDWAKAAGYRSGDNPIIGIQKGLPKQPNRQGQHHAALPYNDVNDFLIELRESQASIATKLAFEFLILTATRTSEVRLATWREVDLENATLTIPAERMKTGKTFRIPLNSRCLEILEQARELSECTGFIFPGVRKENPLSNNTFLKALQRLNRDVTAHGFRSTFRDWAAEKTNFPREVCEMALGHAVGNKTEAAYLRGDLFDKRRELMDRWAGYASTEHSADVIPIMATDG